MYGQFGNSGDSGHPAGDDMRIINGGSKAMRQESGIRDQEAGDSRAGLRERPEESGIRSQGCVQKNQRGGRIARKGPRRALEALEGLVNWEFPAFGRSYEM